MKRIRIVVEIEDDDGCISVNERSHVDSPEMPLSEVAMGLAISSAADLIPRSALALANALVSTEVGGEGDALGPFTAMMDAAEHYCNYWENFDRINGR